MSEDFRNYVLKCKGIDALIYQKYGTFGECYLDDKFWKIINDNKQKIMDTKNIAVRKCLDNLVHAKQQLRDLDVIRSERLVGEIGEWLVESIYGGDRAKSSSQKGYDILTDGIKIQVKTHAKGDANKARWTDFKYERGQFDVLIIIVMTKEFYLKDVFYIPEDVAFDRIDENKKQRVLDWDKYSDYSVKLRSLPNQEIVQLFCH